MTGASGGIGQAILPSLAELDNVIAISHSKPLNVDQLDDIESYQVDLTSESQVNKFVLKIKSRLSKVVLIHAAVISLDNLAVKFETEDWNQSINLNLNGNFFLTRALLTTMIEDDWGRIVHMSSIAAIKGVSGTIAYSTSKTGLLGMSKVLANEYARFGITSNVLIPGYLDTGLIDTLDEKSRLKILESIPSKKLGSPSNIVNAIDFLIKSEYVNGSSIYVDGGI
ncbi:MAG: SDR family oxidoreductase [Flavobacteriales bacterium]|nr:SDR family oxidoreductase [Flavobacteriales bacterium]